MNPTIPEEPMLTTRMSPNCCEELEDQIFVIIFNSCLVSDQVLE